MATGERVTSRSGAGSPAPLTAVSVDVRRRKLDELRRRRREHAEKLSAALAPAVSAGAVPAEPDEEALLEQRLRQLEEELQNLLDITDATGSGARAADADRENPADANRE